MYNYIDYKINNNNFLICNKSSITIRSMKKCLLEQFNTDSITKILNYNIKNNYNDIIFKNFKNNDEEALNLSRIICNSLKSNSEEFEEIIYSIFVSNLNDIKHYIEMKNQLIEIVCMGRLIFQDDVLLIQEHDTLWLKIGDNSINISIRNNKLHMNFILDTNIKELTEIKQEAFNICYELQQKDYNIDITIIDMDINVIEFSIMDINKNKSNIIGDIIKKIIF